MGRIRTFIAVDLTKPIRDRAVALQRLLARSGAEVNWVEPENLHVTLLFLGEVEDREAGRICRIASESTKQLPAFTMTIEGIGCFPNSRRPRIIWLGVGEGAAALINLHDELELPLAELGYRREERRYTPHVTLGRVKSEHSTQKLTDELGTQGGWQGGATTVREISVMASELTSRGPVYTVLGHVALSC